MERFERFYQGVGRALEWLALGNGVILFVLMWMVNFDALSRKIFNAPLQGTVEITGALMPLVVLLPLAYTQFRRGHIKVDMLVHGFGPRMRRLCELLALFCGLLLFVWIAYATAIDARTAYDSGETVWGVIRFEIWPSKLAVFIAMVLLTCQFVLDVVHTIVAPMPQTPANPIEEHLLHG
ncbi:MAG: TRAP transporter small permease subunit [Reyranellaceae bacterium]